MNCTCTKCNNNELQIIKKEKALYGTYKYTTVCNICETESFDYSFKTIYELINEGFII